MKEIQSSKEIVGENDQSRYQPFSRRSVLRAAGIAGGAALAGGFASSPVAARGGGHGFVSNSMRKRLEADPDQKFYIANRQSATFEASPSCNGRGRPQTYQRYWIRGMEPFRGTTQGGMFINPNRNIVPTSNPTDGDWYRVVNISKCTGSGVLTRSNGTQADRTYYRVEFAPFRG